MTKGLFEPIVEFGKYANKNSNDFSSIKWIVLDIKDEKALLLSLYVLDAQNYHDEYEETTWENCSLRRWLNETFFDRAFSKSEKSNICPVNNDTPDPHKMTIPIQNPDPSFPKATRKIDIPASLESKDTLDKVFLLSTEEFEKYSDTIKPYLPIATPYALSNGLMTINDGCSYRWWLRTRGKDADLANFVFNDNRLSKSGFPMCFSKDTFEGIRPAVWIKASALLSDR